MNFNKKPINQIKRTHILGWLSKVIRVADAVAGKTRYNYDHSAKINLIMLEQEFWTSSYKDNIDISAFNHSQSNPFTFPSGHSYDPSVSNNHASKVNNPFFYTGPLNITNDDKDAFYRILIEDHYDMLQTIHNRKTHTTNLWKSFDYLGYVKNFANGYTPKHYGKVFGGPNNPVLSDYDFRQSYAQKTRPITSGTFLTYYRNGNPGSNQIMTNGDINFDFTDPNSNFTQRLKGLAENNGWSNTPLRVIPLQSSEDISCGQADFLGNWLGGINRPNIAELNYADQYRDNFKPSNMAATNEINHIANGWFKFTCMSNNDYSLAPGDPFNSIHERFNCTVYNNSISVEEENLSTSLISVYPNPFNNSIQIMLLDSNLNGSEEIHVFNSVGQEMLNDDIISRQKTIETSSWKKGIYIIKISNNTKEIYNEVFIKQ